MKMEWTRTVVPERDEAGRLRHYQEHEAPVDVQDGGQAQIVEFFSSNMGEGLFVRVHSWDPSREHPDMALIMGKRVRVTVEVLEE